MGYVSYISRYGDVKPWSTLGTVWKPLVGSVVSMPLCGSSPVLSKKWRPLRKANRRSALREHLVLWAKPHLDQGIRAKSREAQTLPS